MATGLALVVEDDPDIRELIRRMLAGSGLDVQTAESGDEALAAVAEHDPDLITLDLSLPGMDGVEICRRVREQSDCYIIMVTARTDEIDRLIGLEVGADDFMCKPFSPRELRARVAAMFRRPRGSQMAGQAAPTAPQELDCGGGLVVNVARREVTLNGSLVPLSPTEFDLLALLATRAGTVCSRPSMVQAIWKSSFADDNHLVDVHIANLRRKLQDQSVHRWIHTVRGVGYRLDPVE